MCLSQNELDLLNDSSFLLRKRAIQDKILKKLDEIRATILENNPPITDNKIWPVIKGKISRGENYQSLPYYVLDCPANYGKDSILAIRTMIWWGHEISCTLHIQGNALSYYLPKVLKNLDHLEDDLFIGINQTPWEYHFEENNYCRKDLKSLKEWKEFFNSHDFIKISKKYPIESISELHYLVPEAIKQFSRIIT